MNVRIASTFVLVLATTIGCSTEKKILPTDSGGGNGGTSAGGSGGSSNGGSSGTETTSSGGTGGGNEATSSGGSGGGNEATSSGGNGSTTDGTDSGGSAGTTSSTGGATSGGGEGGTPPVMECGDGTVDDGEECDDGNDIDADGCQADCTDSFTVTGPVEVVDPTGLDLTTGVTENTNTILFFPESLGHTISAGGIPIDLHVPGTYEDFNTQPGRIPEGAVVNSYYFHHDIVGTGPATPQSFTFTFPDEIMAVIGTDASLGDTHIELGVPGVNYGDGNLNNGDTDVVTMSADRRTLSVITTSGGGADHMRVITRAEGDPDSLVYSGGVSLVAAPSGPMATGDLEAANGLLFPEKLGVNLASNLNVNLVDPATYAGTDSPGVALTAGTAVSSHLVHYDPPGIDAVTTTLSVTFPMDVIGLATLNASLDASDVVGSAGTTYPTGTGRGLEASDVVTIHADQQSITLTLAASTGIDQVRALTSGN